VDLFGGLDEYKYTDDPDSELIQKDWENAGNDIQEQIDNHERSRMRIFKLTHYQIVDNTKISW